MEKLKFIDAHSHLNFAAFDADREEVIERTLGAGVGCVNIGTQKVTSQKAVEIAERYDGMFAAVGMHPIHAGEHFHDTDEMSEEVEEAGVFDADFYENLAKKDKVVAVGECGLDYFHVKKEEDKIKQQDIFRQQIELSLRVKKPLVIHCRDAHEDLLHILQEYSGVAADMHFFGGAGSWENVEKYLGLGFYLSFTGVITFAKYSHYDDLRSLPLNRILIETDAPYAAPEPYRGKRNEPLYAIEVVKKIAELRNLSLEKVAEITTQNAINFFNLSL
ncbi:MAG: TatD family hydrolase [Candidatus Niyogibacteria bacterium]|nr:TatD family hydrolase [Candidatus Niyogibacteria bacterium]